MTALAGADRGHRPPQEKGTDSTRALARSQVSLSSPASSNMRTYCAGRAKGAQCTESAELASEIVPGNPRRKVCIRSVWRSRFHEYT